jgi:hypothetical protein
MTTIMPCFSKFEGKLEEDENSGVHMNLSYRSRPDTTPGYTSSTLIEENRVEDGNWILTIGFYSTESTIDRIFTVKTRLVTGMYDTNMRM